LRVDMSEETVSPDGVHVTGSFQGWDPAATEMTAGIFGAIYSYTITADPGESKRRTCFMVTAVDGGRERPTFRQQHHCLAPKIDFPVSGTRIFAGGDKYRIPLTGPIDPGLDGWNVDRHADKVLVRASWLICRFRTTG